MRLIAWKGATGAGNIPDSRLFNLDHLSPHIRHDLGTEWTRYPFAQLNDFQTS
jgi:hypothetical protein